MRVDQNCLIIPASLMECDTISHLQQSLMQGGGDSTEKNTSRLMKKAMSQLVFLFCFKQAVRDAACFAKTPRVSAGSVL